MAKFAVGDQVYSLEYQEPGVVKRVLNEDEGFVPVYEVALLDDEVESDDEMLVYAAEDQLESDEPEVDPLREGIQRLIDDLDRALADGTIYTYGQVQQRLGDLLEGERWRLSARCATWPWIRSR